MHSPNFARYSTSMRPRLDSSILSPRLSWWPSHHFHRSYSARRIDKWSRGWRRGSEWVGVCWSSRYSSGRSSHHGKYDQGGRLLSGFIRSHWRR